MEETTPLQTVQTALDGHPFQPDFSYEPDEFQKRAFYRILRNEHVFVSVPTGAGKTTVAEFAIQKCLHEGASIIYTAPIKALCNQKFYDFQLQYNDMPLHHLSQDQWNDDDDFDDDNSSSPPPSLYSTPCGENEPRVGILTGDAQENEEAPCLVMTTEVLRNKIFRRDSYLDRVQWVIFDEVHYISNEERGQVWEEVIQWAPRHIHFIFLSATSPNRQLFCQWVSRVRHDEPVWMSSHTLRPVPLDFWLYAGNPATPSPSTSLETPLPQHHQEGWIHLSQSPAQRTQVEKTLRSIAHKRGWMKQDRTGWMDFVRKLDKKQLLPAVIFGFQKKRLEDIAHKLGSLALLTKHEQYRVRRFLKTTFVHLGLTPEQQQLPQILQLTPLLEAGIGFHHSGLLPFLKEIVEVLFSNGLMKILCATETFAMGLNMPTRTVVFSGIQKWDGRKERLIDPSEWLQMAGRAGRRGKDPKGYVIVPANDSCELLADLLWAEPKPMVSHFEASYATILHQCQLPATTDIHDETYTRTQSFRDFMKTATSSHSTQAQTQDTQSLLRAKYQEQEQYAVPDNIQSMYRAMLDVSRFLYERPILHQWLIQHTNQNAQFLQGRWVWVSPDPTRMYPVLCRVRPMTPQGTFTVQDEETQDIFNIQAEDILAVLQQQQPPTTPQRIDRGFYTKLSKTKLSLDMIADFATYWDLLEQAAKNQSVPVEPHVVEQAHAYFALQDEIDELRYELGEEDPDQIAKKKFLRSLGYLTDEDTLTLKGRIAREIHSTHPVLLTELLLHAVFQSASPTVAGTILSSFTVPRKSSSSASSSQQVYASFPVETMEEIRAVVKDKTAHCIHMEEEAGIQSKETELWYDTFTTDYEPFFWQWMQPETTFCEWVKQTGWEEGLLVRWILRTTEFCRELQSIFETIGNDELYEKCKMIEEQIQRNMIATRSIYW